VGLSLSGLQGIDDLLRLLKFLFAYWVFLTVLTCAARFVLPSREQRTRGGVPPLIRYLAVIVLAICGLFSLLSWAFEDLDFTPLFVTSGVVSIVVGMAVKDPLGNLLAGVVVGVERPFTVGDWIWVDDVEGEVVEVSWRATALRTRENDRLLIPNSIMATQRLLNYDRPSALHMHKTYVSVTYGTPPGLAAKALIEAASRVQGVVASPPPAAHFREYDDFALKYELRAWIDNYGSLPVIDSDLRREIWYAFKRHGITIPFPIRDVNLRRAMEPPMLTRARLVAQTGPISGGVYELGEEPMTIGRHPRSRICIADPHVSSDHAVIEAADGHFLVRDLGSRMGTTLNGVRVSEAVLEQGDEINVGPVTLIYEMNAAPQPADPGRRPKPPERHAEVPPDDEDGDQPITETLG
jgi:small-conductance mechanosensitive channel